jgi:hypothetical protein
MTKQTGLRGSDKKQDRLQDDRHGAYDLVGNTNLFDTNQQTSRELAQPGADVRGTPVLAPKLPMEDYGLPEGLKRERKGPLNKSSGRGDVPEHVPQAELPRSKK